MPWSGWPVRTPARYWPPSRSTTWAARWPAPPPKAAPQPSIDANYLLAAVGADATPDLAAAVRAQAQTVKDGRQGHRRQHHQHAERSVVRAVVSEPAAPQAVSLPDLRLKSARGRWMVAARVLGSGMPALDATVVGIALPAIGRNFHASVVPLNSTST